jgi:putative oxidoreductase
MIRKIIHILERVGYPIVALLTRLFLFNVFYTSGFNKLENAFNGQWENTVLLFEEIHPVPFLPAEVAAVFGTGAEVAFSLLLILGLVTRLAALGLIGVTAMIELSFRLVDPEYITFDDHIMWALLLGMLATKGAGIISVDGLLSGRKSA